jgi:hypothetical protein
VEKAKAVGSWQLKERQEGGSAGRFFTVHYQLPTFSLPPDECST